MSNLWITPPISPLILSSIRKIYKYSPLRGALGALVILCAGGCTVAQEKAQRYQAIGEQFSNPKQVIVTYTRVDNTLSGMECRCFGEACEQPPFTK